MSTAKNEEQKSPRTPPQEGMRVCNVQYIDRYPHFLLDQVGLTGTVTSVEEHIILVKMVDPIPGCEQWDNEIQLTDDEFGDYGNGVVIGSMIDLFYYYFAPLAQTTQYEGVE
jgi:hypothetical protein